MIKAYIKPCFRQTQKKVKMNPKEILYIIEEIENNIATLFPISTDFKTEQKAQLVPLVHLPSGAKEGDVIKRVANTLTIDKELTKMRMQKIQKRLNAIFENSKNRL